ncbi:hypothetical protein [Zoogloea sp.]|uniref:hypothetical protein n=1 Tax=Zoogloea sp. TaxID=49181 RepID=UPI002BFC2605|nr:hypothetical protein [Nitrospira sp.]HNE32880.1 hypothetical protein [Nitrospira sp.]HNF61968.1 hypothetical protein [Rhodocyclaceae bacterium]
MNSVWNFEDGHLVARNQVGAVLWAWLADEAMGRPLADLLNHSQSLSRLLLPPWPDGQATQTSESSQIAAVTA